MFRILLATILLFCAHPAFAIMDKPPEITKIIHSSKAYGEGAYTKLLFKAYDASLWTDAPSWSMNDSFALSLQYNMHFKSEDIAARSIEEIQHTSSISDEEASDYANQLRKLFPSVNKGDIITALWVPNKGTTFYYNGRQTGTITDPKFSKQFFDIWLSERTSAPDLRKQLLGSHS